MDVERRLDRVLTYPSSAAAARASGAVEVEFAVDGGDRPPMERGLVLVRSSACPSLDDAALSAVRALPTLPPAPLELLGRQVVVRARFGEPAMAF